MINLEIPGYGTLTLEYLVLDYNGTLAVDGLMVPGVKSHLNALADRLEIHVVTADTFGKVQAGMEGIPCRVSILPSGDQTEGKRSYIRKLGCHRVVAGGNGRNDRLMLKEAALGFAVILEEGAALETVMAADVVFRSILDALVFLNNSLRMTATLRS